MVAYKQKNHHKWWYFGANEGDKTADLIIRVMCASDRKRSKQYFQNVGTLRFILLKQFAGLFSIRKMPAAPNDVALVAYKQKTTVIGGILELTSRFELPTSSLPMMCATCCATLAYQYNYHSFSLPIYYNVKTLMCQLLFIN